MKTRLKQISQMLSWVLPLLLIFVSLQISLSPPVKAGPDNSGQIIMHLSKENSDANETYNTLTYAGHASVAATTASGVTSTTTFNSASPTLCESADNTSDKFNQVGASAAATGEKCMGTFISPKIGKTIHFCADSTSPCTGADTSSISYQLYSVESASAETVTPTLYIYRWSGSGNPATTDRIATITCADPGTTPTVCPAVPTTATPAQDVTVNAGDRIIAIWTMNLTGGANAGRTLSVYFDCYSTGCASSAARDSFIKLAYTAQSNANSNKPALGGSLDDDFTTGKATTTCTSGGATYNTKWTCINQGTGGAPVTGHINAGDTNSPPTNGDSSGWLWMDNVIGSTGNTTSNFGASPTNTFMYQTLAGDYGNGNVTTVVMAPSMYEVGSTPTTASSPYNNAGLVLWTSDTDYLEIELYSDGAGGGTNTTHVAINNSGSLSNAQNLNSTTTDGKYNNIWLRFANTAGSYQPQYSTDGSSFTNIGSGIAHNAFKRVGLSTFAQVANPVNAFAAGFEWFESTLAAATYNQDAYIWDANADSTTPGAHLAANNTTYTLTSAGQQFRLRLDLRITGQSSAGNSPPAFKLQFVGKGSGTCAAPSGGTPSSYTDVTTSTAISYYNNATPSDGANISTTASDDPTGAGTNVAETYEEANNFSASQSDLNSGNDGLWDFAVYDNGATAGTTYCFKVVTSGGADITTYTNYPEITTFTPTTPTTDQVLRGGEWFNGGTKQSFYWAQ